MTLTIKGYVLEPPRIGGANSAFTITPNNKIANQTAFNTAYPSDESVPRTDYLVLVMDDGLLADATFGFTKNEGLVVSGEQRALARFDYYGTDQRFKPLPGSSPTIVGTLLANANTNRLKVVAPIGVMAAAPYRLSLGTGVGTPFTVALVTAFGAPPIGTVEILTTTGELNWNPTDITNNEGQTVRWQRQQFFGYQESTGLVGSINDVLLLNPLPGTGQYPLVRIGFGVYLEPVEKPNDGSLDPSGSIPSGTVQWSRTTGLLRFSSVDLANFAGYGVYYDGVLFGWRILLPRQSIGTVAAPSTILNLPSEGGDLIFRIPSGYQFPSYSRVTSLTSPGKSGVVQVQPSGLNGLVQFSSADTAAYGSQSLEVVFGDLPVERGIVVRFFRSPVNLTGETVGVKDVAAYYEVEGAILSDPIIAAPQVFLPSLPIDTIAYPVTVQVAQGTGSYTNPAFPRLDVPAPPVGLGYIFDFEGRQLLYAQRKVNNLTLMPEATAGVALPDPLLSSSNLSLELETAPGSNVYTPLVIGDDALVDLTSGVVTFTTSYDDRISDGTASTFSGNTLTDSTASFITEGVQAGDYLVIQTGLAQGVYQVAARTATTITTDVAALAPVTNVPYEVRRGPNVVADRYWQPIQLVDPNTKVERLLSLGVITNSPRLNFDSAFATTSRVRIGQSTFLPLTTVPNDGSFTSPVILPAGTVEVSLATGNLNFSQADLTNYAGQTVYWARTLVRQVEYQINPGLGLISFTDRFLSMEEALITYAPLDTTTGDPLPVVSERATFLIRKEVTNPFPRPTTTNIVNFNPTGRTVAANPAPQVFRGGRPQKSSQVTINTTASTVTFLPNTGFMTDALPSGSQVGTDERVMVDYSVYEAIGGEKTITVLQAPMYVVQVSIQDLDAQGNPNNKFVVAGNQTASFIAGSLLRIADEALYPIATVVYDSGEDTTTVTIGGNSTFNQDFLNPPLYSPSGEVRINPSGLYPSYFLAEINSYRPVARGMNKIIIVGDGVRNYPEGTVVLFTDAGPTFQHFYNVSGSRLTDDGNTEVTLTQNVLREYKSPTVFLKRSVRPILDEGATTTATTLVPVFSEPILVFRRVEGDVGGILQSPTEYKIDPTGKIEFSPPLVPNESLEVFYTGSRVVQAGLRLKSSYTSLISPSESNGLLNQILKMDYWVYSPDNFYYRVETLTNFQGEIAEEIAEDAKGSSPTAGPTTSNASQPSLAEQGRESLFFDEGHLANADLVARAFLKFYNDNVHHLEDVLQDVDGRVVGDVDGRFRFDGNVDNPVRTTYANVTNEIDDVFQISPYPIKITSWLAYTYVGTFLPLYKASPRSRLFPTRKKSLFNVATGGVDTGSVTGDPIVDLRQTDLDTLPSVVFRRWPRAMVVRDARVGESSVLVDNATGTEDLIRPKFRSGMKVRITAYDGTVLISDSSPLTVSSATSSPQKITFSAPLTMNIPKGATVFLCTTGASKDTSYQFNYRLGFDVAVNKEEGQILFIEPYPPFDGPPVPTELRLHPPDSSSLLPAEREVLQMNDVGIFNTAKAAFRFPALDGVPTTDCSDQGIPIQSPTFDQEQLYLDSEFDSLTTAVANTTPTTVLASVSVNAAGTLLTYTGPWPAPVPQIYDLVRFTTGPNSSAGYRRISAVGGTTVTVDNAFPFPSTSGSVVITASANVATGTATFPSPTVLDDPALSAAIQVGHTVVLLSGGNIRLRRQVVARLSATQLQLDAAVPSALLTSYRVSDHLSTYSELPASDALGSLEVVVTNDHNILPAKADSQKLGIERFLDGDNIAGTDGVLTDIIPLSAGTVSGSILTDGSANFTGIPGTDFVYIRTGPNRGFYQVDMPLSATTLQVTTPFPVAAAVAYRVVSAFSVAKPALDDLAVILFAVDDYVASITAWATLVGTVVPVTATPADPAAYGNAVLSTNVTARLTALATRQTFVTNMTSGPVPLLERILGSRDRLYDSRYSWVDARVNLDSGLLYEIDRAVQAREENLEQTKNQLLRLLSMTGNA